MAEKEKSVCQICGSADVQEKVWIYINSREYASDCGGLNDDTWCEKCEGHTGIISESEYNSKN